MREAQGQLFDAGLPVRPLPRGATPYKQGTGPAGETCGSCFHCARIKYHDKRYLKCNIMAEQWTHGAGTDIKAKWPACWRWEPDWNRVWRLGDFAKDILGREGVEYTALSVIADYYEEAGVDVGWLRHAMGFAPGGPYCGSE